MDEGLDAADVMQFDGMFLDRAAVDQAQINAGIQEGQFAQTMLQGGEIEVGLGEGFRRGQEGDLGAGQRCPFR